MMAKPKQQKRKEALARITENIRIITRIPYDTLSLRASTALSIGLIKKYQEAACLRDKIRRVEAHNGNRSAGDS